ncbi:hypothetical protein ACLRGI_17200 [Paenarthrobacter nitroguajacolicus]|uniref:hypothetical protein n=1 Tax=Paenarthrobacter nitroguajacolicus TaxID=211146 RepID=UPI003AE6538E
MSESIPRALQPPVAVALAKLVKTFPGPNALPGGICAEPKWDGYIYWTSSTQVFIRATKNNLGGSPREG